MGAPVEHSASPQFRFYNFRTLTWVGASKRARVPFDNVRGVWGTMGPPNVTHASLGGLPTMIAGFFVTSNGSSIDNSATIMIRGNRASGAQATPAVARRCVFNYLVYGF